MGLSASVENLEAHVFIAFKWAHIAYITASRSLICHLHAFDVWIIAISASFEHVEAQLVVAHSRMGFGTRRRTTQARVAAMGSFICDFLTIGVVGVEAIADAKNFVAKLSVAFVSSSGSGSVALFTLLTAVESVISPLPAFIRIVLRLRGMVANFESSRAQVMQAVEGVGCGEKGQENNQVAVHGFLILG